MMNRPTLVPAALWLAALAGLSILYFADRQAVLHGYLVGWLVLVSFPLGALPVLMALELARERGFAFAAPLRRLLAGLPLLALLALPILLMPGLFYAWVPGSSVPDAMSYTGFASHWFTPAFLAGRGIIFLVIWLALGVVFIVPGRPTPVRRAIAVAGLLLHLVIGTLAAYDWFMTLDPSSVSSAYGVIIMAAQAVLATSVALLMAHPNGRVRYHEMVTLLVLVAIATYMQFSQYLVIWSANLPKEIAWYQTRWRDVVGPLFVIGAPLLLIFATTVLLPESLATRRQPALLGLGAILTVTIADLICLASPGKTFTASGVGVDILGVLVVAGFAALGALVVDGLIARRARHGRA